MVRAGEMKSLGLFGTENYRAGEGDAASKLTSLICSSLASRAALGTMHGKADALSPSFANIGVDLVVPNGLDTDAFGTFTGETKRQGTMLDAARAKARAAATLTGLTIGIGSEGSYGSHPFVPFIPAGRELLVWHDTGSGIDIIDMMIDETPSFAHRDIKDIAEAEDFIRAIDFPRQALVVSVVGAKSILAKGVRDQSTLIDATRRAISLSPTAQARLQTDMRAFMNPRRMVVIAKLGELFTKRLTTLCPDCNHPGWGWVGIKGGLRCSACGCRTQLPSHDVMSCVACHAEQLVERSIGAEADPTFCPSCNP
ncbi:hypothetical protein ASD36_27865 [Rhizobium sp. Root1334]|nr:hypothetical protein ASD36_27865 [Rhizobium sp. Root1334]